MSDEDNPTRYYETDDCLLIYWKAGKLPRLIAVGGGEHPIGILYVWHSTVAITREEFEAQRAKLIARGRG